MAAIGYEYRIRSIQLLQTQLIFVLPRPILHTVFIFVTFTFTCILLHIHIKSFGKNA